MSLEGCCWETRGARSGCTDTNGEASEWSSLADLRYSDLLEHSVSHMRLPVGSVRLEARQRVVPRLQIDLDRVHDAGAHPGGASERLPRWRPLSSYRPLHI